MDIRNKGSELQSLAIVCLVLAIFVGIGCRSSTPRYKTTTTEYTSGGEIAEHRVDEAGLITSELRNIFDHTIIRGEGMFENANEGLARRSAVSLAVAELAGKVQTEVRSNTVIYNNNDVRDVIENSVHALVSNYEIDFAGYDPGTNMYRAKVSVRGETLIREIERRIMR